jgi:hypothetical protein
MKSPLIREISEIRGLIPLVARGRPVFFVVKARTVALYGEALKVSLFKIQNSKFLSARRCALPGWFQSFSI